MEKRKAIYPGTFDPLTNGHLDLVRRARRLFDEIYIVLAVNGQKKTLFSLEERLRMVRKAVAGMPGLHVETYRGLTVDYARKRKVRSILRGVRATSDFDYEFQMALTNRQLSDNAIETIFLMPSENHFYISSRLIKEIAACQGDISGYVPGFVAAAMKAKLKAR
ncbi:MAG: pantetheine-phosphate adenylyltransferase [Candidatus Omnitrophota bacterium]